MPVGSLDELFPDFEPRSDVKVGIVDGEVDPTWKLGTLSAYHDPRV